VIRNKPTHLERVSDSGWRSRVKTIFLLILKCCCGFLFRKTLFGGVYHPIYSESATKVFRIDWTQMHVESSFTGIENFATVFEEIARNDKKKSIRNLHGDPFYHSSKSSTYRCIHGKHYYFGVALEFEYE